MFLLLRMYEVLNDGCRLNKDVVYIGTCNKGTELATVDSSFVELIY